VARTPAAVAVEPATRPVVVRGSDWYVRDTLTSGTADQPVAGDLLGSGFVGGDPSAGSSTAGTVHGRRRANASGLTGDRSSTS
jgi:hypothetical protein